MLNWGTNGNCRYSRTLLFASHHFISAFYRLFLHFYLRGIFNFSRSSVARSQDWLVSFDAGFLFTFRFPDPSLSFMGNCDVLLLFSFSPPLLSADSGCIFDYFHLRFRPIQWQFWKYQAFDLTHFSSFYSINKIFLKIPPISSL